MTLRARRWLDAWGPMLPLLIAEGTIWVGFGALLPILPIYFTAHGVDLPTLGVVVAAWPAARLLGEPLFGWVADRGPRKAMMIVGLLLAAVFAVAPLFIVGPAAFIVIRALAGLATSIYDPAARGYLVDANPPERHGEMFGLYGAAQMGGLMLGPAIGGIAAGLTGQPTVVFWVAGLSIVASAIVVAVRVPKLAHVARAGRRGATSAPGRGGRRRRGPGGPSRLVNRLLIAAVAFNIGSFFASGAYEVVWSLYLTHLGASVGLIGLTFFTFALPILVLSPYFGRFIDREGGFLALVVGMAGVGICGLLYPVVPEIWFMAALGIVEGTGVRARVARPVPARGPGVARRQELDRPGHLRRRGHDGHDRRLAHGGRAGRREPRLPVLRDGDRGPRLAGDRARHRPAPAVGRDAAEAPAGRCRRDRPGDVGRRLRLRARGRRRRCCAGRARMQASTRRRTAAWRGDRHGPGRRECGAREVHPCPMPTGSWRTTRRSSGGSTSTGSFRSTSPASGSRSRSSVTVVGFILSQWVFKSDGTGLIGGTIAFINNVVTIVTVIALAFAVIGFIYSVIQWQRQEYILTTVRVLHVHGVINKQSGDSSLENITDAQIRVPWLGRILGFGDLVVMTASEAGINNLRALRDPIGFKKAHDGEKTERMIDLNTPRAAAQAAVAAPAAASGRPPLLRPRHRSPPRRRAADPDEVAKTIASLAALRDSGAITPEEFEAKKQELLDRI